MRFTLDPDRFVNKMLKNVWKKQVIATRWLLEVIKSLTPEDTGEMIDSYKIKNPKISSFILETWITNSAVSKAWYKYPMIVDKGTWKVYSYQKPKGNRWWYIWKWVHTFERSIAAYKDIFLNIINN